MADSFKSLLFSLTQLPLFSPSPPPPFSLEGSKYDLSTFWGRYQAMLDQCDPSTLLATEKEIRNAGRMLRDFEEGSSSLPPSSLWAAKKLYFSAVHPESKELIPAPFRMAGFVPFNGPVSLGAVLAQRTPWIVFWHWTNQSQNALVNFFNRNGSSPVSNSLLMQSYCLAVTSAVGVAYGLSAVVRKSFSPSQANRVMRFVALPSTMTASSVNCYMMRKEELETGIMLMDREGKEVGLSKSAASKCMQEMILSRMLLPLPVMGFPALMMSVPPFSSLSSKFAFLTVPFSFSFLMLGFGLGLPAAIAYFPQKGEIEEEKVEKEVK